MTALWHRAIPTPEYETTQGGASGRSRLFLYVLYLLCCRVFLFKHVICCQLCSFVIVCCLSCLFLFLSCSFLFQDARDSEIHPAAVRCDMVLHQAFRARHVRTNSIGGAVRHGVTSGVSCETSLKQTCNTSPPQGVESGFFRVVFSESIAVVLELSNGLLLL